VIRALFSALAFLTILPVPLRLQSRRENGMFPAYPLAGLVIGALLAAASAGARWLLPPLAASGILVGLGLLLTGAIHLDGLADCADAFYGRRDRSTVLRILKDPRVGTMGAAAIGVSLLLRAAAFASLPGGVLMVSLVAASVLSRSAVLPALSLLPYVRRESAIISTSELHRPARALIGAGGALAAALLFPLPSAIAAAGCALFWRLSWRRIGGCTGDVLGATLEISEVLFFLALAATEHIGFRWGLALPLIAALG
jgi:adenosylcobinamide-GDP ribazoletransferase